MTRNTALTLACASAATALASGCDLAKLAADQTADVLVRAEPSVEREEDIGIAENAIAANLKLFEGLIEVSPKKKVLYTLTAQAFGSYAFGFIDPRIESISDPLDPTRKMLVSRAMSCYRRGRGYAEKWMSFKVKDISAKLHGPRDGALAAIAALDKKMVPGLFWAGYNWAQLINLRVDELEPATAAPAMAADDSGDVSGTPPPPAGMEGSAEGEIEVAKAIMRRVVELDETYFNASAHSVLGVMEGVIPKSLGGRADESLVHFDRAIALTGGKFLLPKVFKAQFWATNVGDRAAFVALLKEVIDAPPDIFPDQRLANELAKGRAHALMAQIDTLFVSGS
jgi:hypothetical protein